MDVEQVFGDIDAGEHSSPPSASPVHHRQATERYKVSSVSMAWAGALIPD